MPKQREVTLREKPIEEIIVELEGTAPVLVGHPLAWDMGRPYWEAQPPEVSNSNIKRPTSRQLALLQAVSSNGYDLSVGPYDEARGVNAYQEAILRGHWLADHSPAFPISGFQGAIAKGAAQYGGKNYGLPATKLRALMLLGDPQNTIMASIATAGVAFDEDIGRNSGMVKAPRLIIRILYELPWTTTIRVRFSPALITAQGILQAFVWGGDFGVGQRRPSSPHGGQYGTFRVKSGPTRETQ